MPLTQSVTPEIAGQWVAEHVRDQTGKTILITGANGGLGAATAEHFARAGAHVILGCRRPEEGERVAHRVGTGAEVLPLDLADLGSVATAAESCGPVDTVIALAGICYAPWGLTADGFEQHIGVNHLGHFALIGHLLNKVRDRVVVVTSRALEFCGRAGFGAYVPDDPAWRTRKYNAFDAYCQSKLANLLFVTELQHRLDATGSNVRAVAAQPGWADTEAGMHSERRVGDVFWRASCRLIGQPPSVGALSILYAATSPSARPGGYYGPARLFGMRGLPAEMKPGRAVPDPDLTAESWAAAERHTGIRFDV
jgi:NAD(P)-dependent dehydrogenase (short-subunit alcohol dehydrogenase family)